MDDTIERLMALREKYSAKINAVSENNELKIAPLDQVTELLELYNDLENSRHEHEERVKEFRRQAAKALKDLECEFWVKAEQILRSQNLISCAVKDPILTIKEDDKKFLSIFMTGEAKEHQELVDSFIAEAVAENIFKQCATDDCAQYILVGETYCDDCAEPEDEVVNDKISPTWG